MPINPARRTINRGTRKERHFIRIGGHAPPLLGQSRLVLPARAVRAGAGAGIEEAADGDADELGEQTEVGGGGEAFGVFPAAPGGLGDAELGGGLFLRRRRWVVRQSRKREAKWERSR